MRKERLRAKRDFEVLNLSGIPLNIQVFADNFIQIQVAVSPLAGTFVLNHGCGRPYRLSDEQVPTFDGQRGVILAVKLENRSDRLLRLSQGYRQEKKLPCIIIRRDTQTLLLPA